MSFVIRLFKIAKKIKEEAANQNERFMNVDFLAAYNFTTGV